PRPPPYRGPVRGPPAPAAPAAPAGTAPIAVQAQLPPLTGKARGYRLDDQPPAGAIERLADAVGVHGAVETDAGGWIVRQDNRLVRVQRAAGLPWFFSLLQGPCSMVPSEALPPVPPAGPTDCPEAEG